MAVLQYFTCNNHPKPCGGDGESLQEHVRPGGSTQGDDTIVLRGIRSWEEVKN